MSTRIRKMSWTGKGISRPRSLETRYFDGLSFSGVRWNILKGLVKTRIRKKSRPGTWF